MKKNYLNVSLRVLKSLLFFTVTLSLNAADIYVSTDVNRSHDYTTIQEALDAATPGDVIYVKAGVYYERLIWPISGTPGNSITLRNYNDENVYIDGINASNSLQDEMIYIHNKSHITIQGVVVRNNMRNGADGIFVDGYGSDITISSVEIHDMNWSTDPDAPGPSGNSAHAIHILGNNSSGLGLEDITVDGCWIHDCNTAWSEALTVNGNVDGFLIENNTVEDIWNIGIDLAGHWDWTGAPADVNFSRNGIVRKNTVSRCVSPWATSAGIYTDGAINVIIENNTITGCGMGVEVGMENNDEVYGMIVRNNIVYNNLKGGLYLGAYSKSGMVRDSKISGNVFYHNDMGESMADWSGEISLQRNIDCEIINNIIVPRDATNKKAIIMARRSTTNLLVDYNLYWRENANLDYLHDIGSGNSYSLDQHVILDDPLFFNVLIKDFHIQNNSPAIDAGDPDYVASIIEVDMDGEARIDNLIIDIGADEAVGNSSEIMVGGVSVSPEIASILIGETEQLSAIITPANATNKIVSWATSSSDVAIVDAYGVVTAVAEGSAIITVTTSDGGFVANCTIEVSSGGGGNNTLHIVDITTSSQQAGGPNNMAVAVVYIEDEFGNAVADAVVSGTFSGDFNENHSGITDNSGTVTFVSNDKKKGEINIVFCVDDVEHSNFVYDPLANLMRCSNTIGTKSTTINVSNTELQENIKVYPNPSNGEFEISVDAAYHLKVMNLIGKVVYETNVNTIHKSIYLSDLTKGTYLLVLQNIHSKHNKIIIIK